VESQGIPNPIEERLPECQRDLETCEQDYQTTLRDMEQMNANATSKLTEMTKCLHYSMETIKECLKTTSTNVMQMHRTAIQGKDELDGATQVGVAIQTLLAEANIPTVQRSIEQAATIIHKMHERYSSAIIWQLEAK